MTSNTVKGLQTDVIGKDPVQHPNRMDIVIEMPMGMRKIERIQIPFARMTEGSVTDIMPQTDGFDQVEIQTKGLADGTGNAGYELYVQSASCDVVVFV